MKKLIALALLLIPAPLHAQSRVVKPVDVNALQTQITILQAQLAAKANKTDMPAPATALPNMESTTPSTGASTRYLREDYVPVRITRAKKVSTDSSGNWSVTWDKPLPLAPITLPIPMNTAGGQPIICNVVTSTMTGSTGYCVQARVLPATLLNLAALLSYAITQVAPVGTQVQIFAVPTTD